MDLGYQIRDSENGYRIIEIFENDRSCAEMMLRYVNNQINLSSVECKCSLLKGRCFNLFMQILVETAKNNELFHKPLSPSTEVALFISPEYRDGVKEEDAFNKLQKLYSAYGFLNYDKQNKPYAVSTLNLIDQVVNGGLMIVDDPNRTPVKLRPRTPEKPSKSKKHRYVDSIDLIKRKLTFRKSRPRYMSSTQSSRAKGLKTRRKNRIRKSI